MSLARLRELRMVGFKSFAERTVVRFGPGISAVVGPNGSGKSNLADALRWALGEQGRALRSRRAEDLIFAGSANRRAVGMADVSLVIDNADRLLSVDFGEVELSRRLFRSGENEYLLNRQRIRLRDLVDLLDDANLADNAFLFIGQGMVDQALALRPEERRPLFEEAAGIRKHQRRRSRAEGELAEAESNLERVRDLLGELRPQARRLAAQAEQQEARTAAGAELAAALVEVARWRLGAAEVESRRHASASAAARLASDAALGALRDAEEAAARLTRALADRADAEQQLRARLDEARGEVQRIELVQARAASQAEALGRERARLAAERASAAGRAEEARRRIAAVLPEADGGLEEALDDAERRLADLLRDAEQLREAGRADQQRAAVARAARERLLADADRAARRASESQRRAQAQQASTLAAQEAAAQASERAVAMAEAREVAHRGEEAAEHAASEARMAAGQAAAAAAAAAEVAVRLGAELEGLTARRESLEQELRDGTDERLMRSLRAKGGRRLSDGLEVEPSLRIAVEAALGDVLAGLVLDVDDAHALSEAAAVLILRDAPGGQGRPAERAVARLEEGVLAAGGGWLADGLRLDPEGQAARLLARCAWVPDLASALSLRAQLPPGWRLVTRDGVVLDDLAVVRPAPGVSKLERRELRDEIVRRLERLQPELDAARATASGAERAREQADAQVATARDALDEARRARRLADEADRSAASAAENAGRERAWQEAMLERARSDADTAARESASRDQEIARLDAGRTGDDPTLVDHDALRSLEARVGSLRSERDQLATMVSEGRAVRERALEERRRAEVGLGLAEARQLELDQEAENLGSREASLAGERERAAAALASAVALQQQASDAYAASVASARAEREELLAAEAAAGRAREQLRVAEQRSRASEVAEMEARLQVDAAREGLLVELASIGPDSLAALSAVDAQLAPFATPPAEELPELLEAALDAAVARWQAAASGPSEEGHHVTAADGTPVPSIAPSAGRPTDGPTAAAMPAEPPSRARLAALRRRFNEVGAGNPFAAQELAEITTRLESLEAQRDDLERAIRDTRELMARLDELMAVQFRETFEALEGAFARRFHQLFGGGDAQLSLTDPADLASTGVEITARPPGKRRQPLAMLSGGERALTAVSLLMAMLEVRPVPFCVLDEVDAALDEANIGRFSSALRSLAEEIQFVVITHNRGTIEAADALYGVTVGDDAISHVVSLRLEASSEPERAASGALA